MFGSGNNTYDEIVAKASDENLTSENWELILNICDKVVEEGEGGARNVIVSVLKRLAHRNPNVQLYALSLAESLSKNCGIEIHREIASKAFTQGLEKLVTDRTTHDKVKKRTLSLVGMWKAEFERDSSLGVMEDCYNSLKAKGHKFETPQEPLPVVVEDEIRRKEEEELQRVLEMSMQDKGGRNQWSAYSAVSSGGAGGSGSNSGSAVRVSSPIAPRHAPDSSGSSTQNKRQERTPSPTDNSQKQLFQPMQPQLYQHQHQTQLQQGESPDSVQGSSPETSTSSVVAMHTQGNIVTRVRALHNFEATEPGELAFERGDIIKVVDRGYKDWWRGQLKGRTGIFPVNYVEALPEPTPAELAREAEQEASVFAQAVNVEKLLNMLRSFDPANDSLADNEEIQELYRSSMALRPKIVKLIDKYSQKRADLVSMNETFVRARTIFERMMEESLARHTGIYSQDSYSTSHYRPGSDGRPATAGPQIFGWNSSSYNAFPTPYLAAQADTAGYANPSFDPSSAGYAQQFHSQQAAQVQSLTSGQIQVQQPILGHPQSHSPPSKSAIMQHGGYIVQQSGKSYAPQVPAPYTAQSQGIQSQTQSYTPQQSSSVLQHQLPVQETPAQPAHVQEHLNDVSVQSAHTDPEQQLASSQPQQAGPPYVFNPATLYGDPNVQAWAQYYAKGGKDPQGAVYFVSVPGVKPDPTLLTHSELQKPRRAETLNQTLVQHQRSETLQTIQQPSTDVLLDNSRQGSMSSLGPLPYPGDMETSSDLTSTSKPFDKAFETDSSQRSSLAPANSAPSWVVPKRSTSPAPPDSSELHAEHISKQFSTLRLGGDT